MVKIAGKLFLTVANFKKELAKYAISDDATFLGHFFKSGKGQYGEGDIFIGVRVPATRAVCREFKDLPLIEIEKLFASDVHEHRLAAVILLANRAKKATAADKKKVYELYLKALYAGRVNNWDIVDSSAEYTVGEYLFSLDLPRDILFELADSSDIWQRRVAVLSTFAFIKRGDPSTTLALAKILLHDKQDLIQKAVGWLLRETGKRVGPKPLLQFLETHHKVMPRTMLRYAIERLSPEQRKYFMQK